MGNLMRRYWIPALFSAALPEPDCPPVRVKLLGEKLVAVRDSTGAVGLFDERCPHRNASLFFGRNEENGIRCVYHGWKFDLEGNCVDMPSEPAESNFKHRIKATAYPCVERGGDTPDGGIRTLPKYYQSAVTDYGFVSGSGRDLEDGRTAWGANIMALPFHKVIARPGDVPTGTHAWVPIDDENCMIYSIEYRPHRPLNDEEMKASREWRYIHAETEPGSDHCVRNLDNDFLIDRDLQKSGKSFTGLKGFGIQDCGIQESMGPISDRTREQLGTSDIHIVQLRRFMLKTLRDFMAGGTPPGLKADMVRVRSAAFQLDRGQTFEQHAPQRVRIDLPAMAK